MRAAVSEFELTNARTLEEALSFIEQGWRPIAGGTDLMVLFNAGKLPFRRLVSIRELCELRQIEIFDDRLMIGAAVTYSEVRRHPVLQRDFPLLCQAAAWTGGTANQNRGTLGGNIGNASPAADSAPTLLVYDAEVELRSVRGARWLPYASFHLGHKTMEMKPDELITRISLSRATSERVQYARKVGTRKAQAISKVCFAAIAEQRDDAIYGVRIAIGSVASRPLRCYRTESILEGKRVTSEGETEAAHALRSEISPITDIRSTAQYRTQVTVNLLGEFLERLR